MAVALTVRDLCRWMNQQAPLELSESWDNTGLLLGDPDATVSRVQTCLTLTAYSVSEAIRERAEMVITHHPMPFQPLKRITAESSTGSLLWQLAGSGISVYSPHTAWDSAESGINAMLAGLIGLNAPRPIVPCQNEDLKHLGAGRIGSLSKPSTVREIADRLSRLLPDCRPRGVGGSRSINTVAVACGSGASLLEPAVRAGCNLFITGEASFHSCLEAQALDISLLMIGHFASERFSMVALSERLGAAFPELVIWPSQSESDPVERFNEERK
jgi:dinuclear metal center YbgI/SA1388 family protein